MSEENRIHYHEGSPWFWKIFGGAIMGIISILLISHITNINSLIDRSFLDLRGEIKEIRIVIDGQKEKINSLEQSKEKILSLEKTISQLQLSLEEIKQKSTTSEAQIISLKEEIKSLREWNKENTRQLQEVREKFAAAEALKNAENPAQ
jgi:predicted  nucleic acid-binding Zn-ribbon protein